MLYNTKICFFDQSAEISNVNTHKNSHPKVYACILFMTPCIGTYVGWYGCTFVDMIFTLYMHVRDKAIGSVYLSSTQKSQDFEIYRHLSDS